MVIVALSGGKASAYCAKLAIEKYGMDNVELYFNDTGWEHEDLYRFVRDISSLFGINITNDSADVDVEGLFVRHNAIANNRMPFCSRVLKAERLHNYYRGGDTIIFGIDSSERHRAKRIVAVYQQIALKKNKPVKIKFPLISNHTSRHEIDNWLMTTGIEEPVLYKYGFQHNNCSGGCVRAGKMQWAYLYKVMPEVYADRERVEKKLREQTGKDISILKGETLESLRQRVDNGLISSRYVKQMKKWSTGRECVGICDIEN